MAESRELIKQAQQIIDAVSSFQQNPQQPELQKQILDYTRTAEYQAFLNNIFRDVVSPQQFSQLLQKPLTEAFLLKQSLFAFIAFHQTEIVYTEGQLPPEEIMDNYLKKLEQEKDIQKPEIRSTVRKTIDTAEQRNMDQWLQNTGNAYAKTQRDLKNATNQYFDQVFEQVNRDKQERTQQRRELSRGTLQKEDDVLSKSARKNVRNTYTKLISQTALTEYTHEFEQQIQRPGINAEEAHQAALQKAQQQTLRQISEIQDPNQAYFMDRQGQALLNQTIQQTLNQQQFLQFDENQVFEQKKQWTEKQEREQKTANLQTVVAPPPQRTKIQEQLAEKYQEKIRQVSNDFKPTAREDEPLTQKEITQSQFADYLKEYTAENQELLSDQASEQINRLEYQLLDKLHAEEVLQTHAQDALHQTTKKNLELIINNARNEFIRNSGHEVRSSFLKVDPTIITRAATEFTQKVEPHTKEFLEFHFQALNSGESLPGLTISQALLSSNSQIVREYALSFLSKPGSLTEAQLLLLSEEMDVDYIALHAFLKGHNAQTLRSLAEALKSGYQFAGLKLIEQLNPLDPRVLKLLEFADQLEKIETITPQDFSGQLLTRNLFRTLQIRAQANNFKYSLFDQANKLNPFRPLMFGKQYVTDKFWKTKYRIQDKVINEIKKRPVGYLLTPRYKLNVQLSKFWEKHPKLKKTKKKIGKWMPGNIRHTLKKQLAKKALTPIKKKIAKELMKRGMEKAAQLLLKEGFKSLLRFAAVEGLGGTIGAAIGSVIPIPVVGQAIGWLIGTLVFELVYQGFKLLSKPIKFIKKQTWDKLPEDVKKLVKLALPFLPIALFLSNFLLPLLTITLPIITGAALIIKFGHKIWRAAKKIFKGGQEALGRAANQTVNSPVTAAQTITPMVGAGVGISGLAMLIMTIYASTFVPYFQGGAGPIKYQQQKYLKVTKESDPKFVTGPGQTLNYTITVNATVEGVEDVVIKDTYDEQFLSIDSGSINPQPTEISGNVFIWQDFDFSQSGNSLEITYTATTKSGVNDETKIRNTAEATAVYNGENITRKDSVVINSNCADIVDTAKDIMSGLMIKDPSDGTTTQCSSLNSSCYSHYPSKYRTMYNCPSTDLSQYTQRAHTCVYCNNLVTAAYVKNGFADPFNASWADMIENYATQGKAYRNNGSGDPSGISEGDVIFFDVTIYGSLRELGHTGLVCSVEPGRVCACEANTYSNNWQELCYPWNGSSFDSKGGVEIRAIIHTCGEL